MDKLKIEYKKHGGFYCADGQVDNYVQYILDRIDRYIKAKNTIVVSQELIIQAFRAAIHEGKVPHDKIVFIYQDRELHMDENARMRHWPTGFCDIYMDYCERLLAGMFEGR